MNPIQTNKPVFFGNNGEVLKNGYIYIGQPNQDPVPTANRKTVTFQDTSGTQFTAQQPLRTGVDGRIVYQATGKPIIALVDGNYSMLIQDENQVIIKNGYTPFVANSASTAGSEAIIYRSTLVDLKAYNGTPGDYVENVGQVTATDGDGARWLVVSNTGSPGDDIDLIDFDNGTQGVRVFNQVYGRASDYLQVVNLLSEISDQGETEKLEAINNLIIYSTVGPIAPGGDFSSGEIYCSRIGNIITITGDPDNTPSVDTAIGGAVIPIDFRPSGFVGVCSSATPSSLQTATVFSDGTFSIRNLNTDTGVLSAITNTWQPFSITFVKP